MKQLLSIAKQRKGNELKPIKKQLILKEPQDQQYNFIYQEQEDDQDGPTDQEVRSYAEILGVRLPGQQDLLYIVKECLMQQTPAEWECRQDERGQIIYQNLKTGQISFQHPCDQTYRRRIISERKKKVQSLKKNITKISLPKSKTSFVQNIFKKEQKQQEQQIQDFVHDNIQKRKKSKKHQNNDLYLNLNDNDNFKLNADQFLYNQRPKHKQMKNNSLKSMPKMLKEEVQQKQKIVQLTTNIIKIQTFKNKQNHHQLLDKKKKQIQQKVQNKYKDMNIQLQDKYRQTIENLKNNQKKLKQEKDEQIKQRFSSKLERIKKQIQMKHMLQHSADLDRLRIQYQKQYRKDIVSISSKYQIQMLFSQMAKCQKFVKRQKLQSEKQKYMQQIIQNVKITNQLQIDKVEFQLQIKCRSLIHKLIDQLIGSANLQEINWEMQIQLTNRFNVAVQQIINSHKQNTNEYQTKKQIDQKKYKQQKQEGGEELYGQLEQLRNKLNQLKQQNHTQRSNLSDKQNKLFQLLQNKVNQNSARSSNN